MAGPFDEMIDRVRNKAGIPEDKARSAVETVVGYVKEKYPSIGNQMDSFLRGGSSGNVTETVKDKLGFK